MQSYETDVIAWANEQAAFIRAGRFDMLDVEHIADEIEDVGKSEQNEFEKRMASLLANLIKWEYQPSHRGRSWERTIKDQRTMIERRLTKTPSLKPELMNPDFWAESWADAARMAENETGILNVFPASCPWSSEQVMNPDFWPE
ncbi:DUF29 domain-containing protein [Candidatus Methylobacter oryzae]|uniref:DUF29 domain-containing protein n=1 Tax=Candidatus Methylobacter oryzae TaxID=2497749 RepID=A0ABY3C5M4_9GAMM|nr:DUF29 domain-containing protein [Candidatus Methylobacter oryzae]TRW90314.1 DUF29 domain-containing protein [Candidatus Methylobacter oryzae]